jgi:hypothetical protein
MINCYYNNGKKMNIIIIPTGEIIEISADNLNQLILRDDILSKNKNIKSILDIHWNVKYNNWTINQNKLKYLYYLNDKLCGNDLTNELFVDFLKTKKIYNKFIKNMIRNQNKDYSSIFTFCDEIEEKRYIDIAFDWKKTPEKIAYWINIYYNWISFLKKK